MKSFSCAENKRLSVAVKVNRQDTKNAKRN